MNSTTLIARIRDAGLIGKVRGIYADAQSHSEADDGGHADGIAAVQLFIGDTLKVWPSLDVVDNALCTLGV